jgi:hypothetical protein
MILGIYMGFVLALLLGACVSAFTHPHRHDVFAEKVALLPVTAILGWWLFFQIVRSGALIASPSGIVVRCLIKTHRLPWKDLDRFEEMVLPIAVSRVPRRFLRVHFPSGRFRDFAELNDSRRRNPDLVAEMVRRLSEMKKSAEIQPHRRTSGGQVMPQRP